MSHLDRIAEDMPLFSASSRSHTSPSHKGSGKQGNSDTEEHVLAGREHDVGSKGNIGSIGAAKHEGNESLAATFRCVRV